jgi:hypothetical protein
MSAEVEIEDAVAGLYRLPLAEFVAARDQLARQLRAAGDREAALRVAALRRPSVSAWAANQLAQAVPHAMAELLEVGAALRQAQQDALAGQPGGGPAAAEQLGAAAERAETLLTRAGHAASDATLGRLAATLQAAATANQATRAALADGRLAGDLDPAGFGLPVEATAGDAASADAVPMPPAAAPPPALADRAVVRREQARLAAQRALERTGQAAEQARAALERAQAMAAGQQQAALAARQRAEELADAARELAEQAAAAAATATQARQQAEAAERDAQALADPGRAGPGSRHGRRGRPRHRCRPPSRNSKSSSSHGPPGRPHPRARAAAIVSTVVLAAVGQATASARSGSLDGRNDLVPLSCQSRPVQAVTRGATR